MRRAKLVLAVVALLAMLVAVSAAPAMAREDIDRECFPFCDDHHHNGDHDGDGIEDVDVEGPFLVGDEICVFVITEFEDDDVDVDEECVNL